jgi:hypothetical protein
MSNDRTVLMKTKADGTTFLFLFYKFTEPYILYRNAGKQKE